MESTYGDRTHGEVKAIDSLASAVLDSARRKGVIVMPAFAVGRTQEVLYDLRALEEAQRIRSQRRRGDQIGAPPTTPGSDNVA